VKLFFTKLLHSSNAVCTLFTDSINKELASLVSNLTKSVRVLITLGVCIYIT